MLRFLNEDKMVFGLMCSNRPEEAAAHVPLERLALSYQCGFSSTAHGNLLGEDEQWRKLGWTVEVANQVWGP